MSTKIYDAYSICLQTDDPDISEMQQLHEFKTDLQKLCMEQSLNKAYEFIGRFAANLIDDILTYIHHPDLSAMTYDDFKAHLVYLYNQQHISVTNIIQNHIRNKDKEKLVTFDEMIANMQKYSFYTIPYFATNFVSHKIECASHISSSSSPYRMTNHIVLIPYENRIALIAYGNIVTNLMETMICSKKEMPENWKAFQKKYDIQDFHYQNQTDHPDDISDEEWDKREAIWETILPSGIPFHDGITLELTNENIITMELSRQECMHRNEHIAKILSNIPDTAKRSHEMTMHYMDVCNCSDKTSTSEILDYKIASRRAIDDYRFKQIDSPYAKQYQEIKHKLDEILPTIDETILTKTIPKLLGLTSKNN